MAAARSLAVVTGGNRGIGRAIALAFAREGSAVAICGRDEQALAAAGAELAATGAEHLALRCDVADAEAVEAFANSVAAALGTPTTVVSCAGIEGPMKPLHEIEPAEWEECIAVDLTGVYLTFRAFIPSMLEARRGSLIAISSVTGKRPLAGRTPYAAAKLGVIGLVRTLAVELGPHGIRVNSVCPGGVEGARIERVIDHQAAELAVDREEARRRFTEPAALKRLVAPDEVANACVFLASDAASGITGEDVNVSAGLVMY